MERVRIKKEYRDFLKIASYTFFLLCLQSHFIARLPYRALRVDLLLPAMVGIALTSHSIIGILTAFTWGYVVDVLSGKFWGFHVTTYVITVLLVNMTAQKVEFYNPFYQMLLILLCVLGQSTALGLFLWIKSPAPLVMEPFLRNLGIRSLLTTLLTPLIISPILRMR